MTAIQEGHPDWNAGKSSGSEQTTEKEIFRTSATSSAVQAVPILEQHQLKVYPTESQMVEILAERSMTQNDVVVIFGTFNVEDAQKLIDMHLSENQLVQLHTMLHLVSNETRSTLLQEILRIPDKEYRDTIIAFLATIPECEGGEKLSTYVNTYLKQLVNARSKNMMHFLQKVTQLEVLHSIQPRIQGITKKDCMDILFRIPNDDFIPYVIQLIEQKPDTETFNKILLHLSKIQNTTFYKSVLYLVDKESGTINWKVWSEVAPARLKDLSKMYGKPFNLDDYFIGLNLPENFIDFYKNLPHVIREELDLDASKMLFEAAKNCTPEQLQIVISFLKYIKPDECTQFIKELDRSIVVLDEVTLMLLQLIVKDKLPIHILSILVQLSTEEKIPFIKFYVSFTPEQRNIIKSNIDFKIMLLLFRKKLSPESLNIVLRFVNELSQDVRELFNEQLQDSDYDLSSPEIIHLLELTNSPSILYRLSSISELLIDHPEVKNHLLKPPITNKIILNRIKKTIEIWLKEGHPAKEILLNNRGVANLYFRIGPDYLEKIKDLQPEELENIRLNFDKNMQKFFMAFDVIKEDLGLEIDWRNYGSRMIDISEAATIAEDNIPDLKKLIAGQRPELLPDVCVLFRRFRDNYGLEFVEKLINFVAAIQDTGIRQCVVAYLRYFPNLNELNLEFDPLKELLSKLEKGQEKLVPFLLFLPKELIPIVKVAKIPLQNPESLFNPDQLKLYHDHLKDLDKMANKMLLGHYFSDIRDPQFGQPILTAAEHFLKIQALHWIPSAEDTLSNRGGIRANDFMIFFKYDTTVLKKVFDYVGYRFNSAKLGLPLQPESRLRMCCWEFVLLTLVHTGAVTEEKIRELYHKDNEKGLNQLAVRATLNDASPEAFPLINETEAQPGDILLYQDPDNLERIYHASIFASKGKVIELLSDTVKESGIHKPHLIRVVPARMVAQNIDTFVKSRELLPPLKKEPQDLSNTQYHAVLL